MEDPKSRPAVAKLIDSVIDIHQRSVQNGVYGWSLAMKIWDRLRLEGLLNEPGSCPCPYDCDGCHEGDGVCWRGNPELWEEQEQYG